VVIEALLLLQPTTRAAVRTATGPQEQVSPAWLWAFIAKQQKGQKYKAVNAKNGHIHAMPLAMVRGTSTAVLNTPTGSLTRRDGGPGCA
jgi:hypothetical protein